MIESDLAAVMLQLRTQFETLGFSAEELSSQEKWTLLYQFFNPERQTYPLIGEYGAKSESLGLPSKDGSFGNKAGAFTWPNKATNRNLKNLSQKLPTRDSVRIIERV